MTPDIKQKRLLEISVGSLEHALAAQRGGADRIELCVSLDVGGLTPDDELAKAVRANLQIPIFTMVRPRAGGFVYSDAEFAAIRSSIERARQFQMDGVVLGILTPRGRVDVPRTLELVNLAKGMAITFHRAIDEAADFLEAFEDIKQTGANRILTSGGAPSALAGATQIAKLVARSQEKVAQGNVAILPGAGINAENICEVARITGAREFHSGLSSVLGRTEDATRFEAEVKRLITALAREPL